MTLYPENEPYDHGWLDASENHAVYWETCGNPRGRPAVVLHGGPGSGCGAWFRRLFDPEAYRTVLFDQRNCGRSRPHAGAPGVDLSSNTTPHLVGDIDLLREHLGVERWLVVGGSWGSTLALAYAEAHADRVSEMVLFGVTTGRHSEFDWTFRGGAARFFPAQWERLQAGVQSRGDGEDIVAAYHRLLFDPDPAIRQTAARAWCTWESATADWPPTDTLQDRFKEPEYALAFARIVTHYVRYNAWLDDGRLVRDARLLADIPGVLVHGRYDFQAPLENAWTLHRAWPGSELVVVDGAGHTAGAPLVGEVVRATDRFR